VRDEACPVSTEGGTRRVRLVREGERGGGQGRTRRTRRGAPRGRLALVGLNDGAGEGPAQRARNLLLQPRGRRLPRRKRLAPARAHRRLEPRHVLRHRRSAAPRSRGKPQRKKHLPGHGGKGRDVSN
jgi:hypothetical protein